MGKRIVSLSSIPPRFREIGPTLESLLKQGAADEVRLYIPATYRRFADYAGELPLVPDDVIIRRVESDYGPATKILPAAAEFRGMDVQILFCDDDGTHPRGWAQRLFSTQAQRPDEAVATWGRSIGDYVLNAVQAQRLPQAKQIRLEHDLRYRSERILQKLFGFRPLRRPMIQAGYADVFFGVGGVVVRPDFFDSDAYDIPDCAWPVDDVWLSAQLAKNDIPIYCPRRFPCPRETGVGGESALLDTEFLGLERQALNRAAALYCQQRYGIWQS
jgi:hypothetical protein